LQLLKDYKNKKINENKAENIRKGIDNSKNFKFISG